MADNKTDLLFPNRNFARSVRCY